jgi:Domain of unknown function (DUF4272)
MPDHEDLPLNPPDANRVAARALVLAAVSCRGLIERDPNPLGAEKLRQEVVGWLDSVGAAEELEPSETLLISTPLGMLDQTTIKNASWRSEGMIVLAWALGYSKLPDIHTECAPSDTASGMGFLDERCNTPLHSPRLRSRSELDEWTQTYLTLHWRLRQFTVRAEAMDFVQFVLDCDWGPLRLDHLEVADRDLAIRGVRIDKVEYNVFHQTLSIAQERHQAFNWILGFEPTYSQVTTDT